MAKGRKTKYNLEYCRDLLMREHNIKLLSTAYKNTVTNLILECENGHKIEKNLRNIHLHGINCPNCKVVKKTKIERNIIKEKVKKTNLTGPQIYREVICKPAQNDLRMIFENNAELFENKNKEKILKYLIKIEQRACDRLKSIPSMVAISIALYLVTNMKQNHILELCGLKYFNTSNSYMKTFNLKKIRVKN